VTHVREWSAALALLLAGCESGDNSAVRSFHATLKPAAPLLDLVRNGESAQKEQASFLVVGQDCAGPYIHIGRSPELLRYIRVTQPQAASNPSSQAAYTEMGYATRQEFLQAVEERLPSFYSCKTFRFDFGRDQFWPTSDSFTVTIDAKGNVTSVSELKEGAF
jgi:hypothetical protein